MIKFYRKIQKDSQLRLFELLKLRKILETLYLRGSDSLSSKDWKIRVKAFVLTRSLGFLTESDIERLRKKITKYLDDHFQEYKEQGHQIAIPNLGSIEVEVPFFKELIDFNSQLEDGGASLIVQGSYADGTFINYSDIDLVIIGVLSNEIRKIKKAIDSYLLNLDPLQHHGVFFIHKDNFSNYWQMDLPIDTLKNSVLLSKESSRDIFIPFYFKEKFSAYHWVSNFINGSMQLPINVNSGAFYAKYFLSQLMLVPALLLAYRGDYVYKKESFPMAKKLYSDQAWKCIETASLIRLQWDQGNISHKYSTGRKSAADIQVHEYNTLPDVMDMESISFSEFDQSYQQFTKETRELLNEIR